MLQASAQVRAGQERTLAPGSHLALVGPGLVRERMGQTASLQAVSCSAVSGIRVASNCLGTAAPGAGIEEALAAAAVPQPDSRCAQPASSLARSALVKAAQGWGPVGPAALRYADSLLAAQQ